MHIKIVSLNYVINEINYETGFVRKQKYHHCNWNLK